MSKIAIASTDGETINEHFGQAGEFLIYEVYEDGNYKFLEKRQNILPQGSTDEGHGTAHSAARLLEDVDAVLVSQIGPNATSILESKGIVSFALTSTIDKALSTYGKRSKLIKNISKNPIVGCKSAGGNNSCGCSGGCR